ncbi:hypothetical protein DevBK_19600 [Devosia sp. BK]|uniref:hypothetical protein n=1 Tax=Devosia sp. BK TaxID=2871706 RepID=UPI002939DDC2|nr:hypothetical protein [Devosia sp. BK]MDV3253550.1 hypothetical protein [Devosia sp. BK]
MDITTARLLLENLLERSRSSGEKVFLTSAELKALQVVLGVELAPVEAETIEEKLSPAVTTTAPRIPLIDLTIAPSQLIQDARLCIDFGTSYSKAFMSEGDAEDDPELFDLAIGDPTSSNPLVTPSELLIHGNTLYFGIRARGMWEDIDAPSARLIDSIKQFITLNADVSKLAQQRLDTDKDPQQLFTRRDILLLYLAHLMSLTEAALEGRGKSANIKRRFTHPAWKDGTRQRNEEEMRRLMAEAVLLSRSAPEMFREAIDLKQARQLLDQLTALPESKLPSLLISEPVREATAAGAGALLASQEGMRSAFLVVDIGAGTTDVAGFLCANNAITGVLKISEVSGSADAKNMAGNLLDEALQRFILDRSNHSQQSVEYRMAQQALRRQIRLLKEQLFQRGSITVELPTDEIVEVALSDFRNYPPVQKFEATIREMVAKSAVALAGSADRVNLVATGGGASLPLIGDLGETGVNVGDKYVRLSVVDAVPSSVRTFYPGLIPPYTQIAVALGGSLSTLPEEIKSLPKGIVDAPKYETLPSYKS